MEEQTGGAGGGEKNLQSTAAATRCDLDSRKTDVAVMLFKVESDVTEAEIH